MTIDILTNNEIIINNNKGYYIIREEKDKTYLYQKYDSETPTYYIRCFDTIIEALRYVRTFIK